MKLGGDPIPLEAEVHCIACGNPLSFLPDSYPLAFHCEGGHWLTMQDLLDEGFPRPEGAPAAALTFWARQALLLHRLAGQALERGHAFIAADFQETAGRIDNWVAQLRTLLPKSGR